MLTVSSGNLNVTICNPPSAWRNLKSRGKNEIGRVVWVIDRNWVVPLKYAQPRRLVLIGAEKSQREHSLVFAFWVPVLFAWKIFSSSKYVNQSSCRNWLEHNVKMILYFYIAITAIFILAFLRELWSWSHWHFTGEEIETRRSERLSSHRA